MSVANPDYRLAIYIKCKEFKCLPDKGGIYDQNPEIIDAFEMISYEISKVEAEKQRKQEMETRRLKRR